MFKPVQHYICHIPYIIRQLGPLRAYSTRSMERSIGVFSRIIKSKRAGGQNASNLIERVAIQNYIDCTINIGNLINILKPRQYQDCSYMNDPNDVGGAQLWEKFTEITLDPESLVEGVNGTILIRELKKFYSRIDPTSPTIDVENIIITLAARMWNESTVYSTEMYRKIKKETSRGNQYVMFSCLDRR